MSSHRVMIGSKAAFYDFVNNITLPETRDEITGIAYLVFEKLFNLSRTDIMTNAAFIISPEQKTKLDAMLLRINRHEPVQYVLGEADFFGRIFHVNAGVLIPRPETEELVRLVLDEIARRDSCSLIDIGTGSGCIPVTVKLEAPATHVFATDISDVALRVAAENAVRLKADVKFIRHDILHENLLFQKADIVTSNPPYITLHEKNDMSKNVTDYEPHLALFVPDDDPLIFYKRIIAQAAKALREGGMLIVEINEQYGQDVKGLFEASGFQHVRVHRDLTNKDRIVKGYAVTAS